MPENNQINCPKCGYLFNVEDVLANKIEEKYRNELKERILEIEENFREKESGVLRLEKELKKKESEIDSQVEQKLREETALRERKIKERVTKEYEDRIKMLSEENETIQKQNRLLTNAKIENEQLKRKLEEQKYALETEYEQKMTEKLKEEIAEIKRREADRAELKLREKEEVINSMKEQMEEMKRKAEQGSMQLQGEVQELVLEETLRGMFPNDIISEVAKGMRGADVMQTVRNNKAAECGKILYESKRTKKFSDDWIEKLKNDALAAKADACIIVTEAMPEGIEKIGSRDGVWICSFNDFKGLVIVLRESLIKINDVYEAQSNKGDKMQMLYDYLTGNEFRMQMEAIAEGFASLQDGYVREKRAMERIWKEREKQLERILMNTNHFIGSIKGIAGNSIPQIGEISKSNLLDETLGL